MPGTTPEKRARTVELSSVSADSAKLNMKKIAELAAKRVVLKWAKLSENAFPPQKGIILYIYFRMYFGLLVVVDRAPKNGARASPEPLVLFTRARASLGSSPTETSP
jgi:hypothetical protein